jgi:hypothetical protein
MGRLKACFIRMDFRSTKLIGQKIGKNILSFEIITITLFEEEHNCSFLFHRFCSNGNLDRE